MSGQTCSPGNAVNPTAPKQPLTIIAQDITDKACKLKICLGELAARLYPEGSNNKECVGTQQPPACLEDWLNTANDTLYGALNRFDGIIERL